MAARNSFWFKYILSCGAATIAETAYYPLDLMKTRLQIQGERSAAVGPSTSGSSGVPVIVTKRGMFTIGAGIVRDERFFALYKGFVPTALPIYIRMALWSLTFWVAYENIRHLTGASSF